MDSIDLKPDDEGVKRYYDKLNDYRNLDETHEGTVKAAFQHVLEDVGQDIGWTLVQEHYMKERSIRVDGALKNEYNLYHGYWEAKDSDDDLQKEVKKKLEKDYPKKNTVFQAPNRAVLIQDGGVVFDDSIDDPQRLVDLLRQFFQYREPAHDDWERAVEDFKGRVPELGEALQEIIETELEENQRFEEAFQEFFDTCKQAINPNLAEEAVQEMLIQHLLTERIFRKVFKNPDFVRRNVIAREIENVIEALTSRSFSREEFLKQLDRFYIAIEEAAEAAEDFSEKQEFLNSIYEQFFQGFAVDVADTHGIVYTPQPIVDFMVNSVSGLLNKEFDVGLEGDDVHVLDPFVGTGNFIVRTMREIPRKSLPKKYGAKGDPELHANEVMLLPYYVASMNIEHEYYNRIGEYNPFEGICLVDTFGSEDERQRPQLFTEENTERVKRQQQESIKVVLGNPPYNAQQQNAMDDNQNREYDHVDDRIRETYAEDSSATLLSKLYDPYVRAIRWATDRVGDEGVVALVTNSSFVHKNSFDGVRKHLEEDFDEVYVLDCGGNVRKNPKLSGTTHNVFGIQVGVSINFLVKRDGKSDSDCDIYYHRMGEWLRKEERYDVLDTAGDWRGIDWKKLEPNQRHTWLTDGVQGEFESYPSIGNKDARASSEEPETIFWEYSLGVSTNRDAYVYDFSRNDLLDRIEEVSTFYNTELNRYQRAGKPNDISDFLREGALKWSRNLRRAVKSGRKFEHDQKHLRIAHHRPFVQKYLYFQNVAVDERGRNHYFYPPDAENRAICISDTGYRSKYSAFICDEPADLHLCATKDGFQCFPFYVYDEDGKNRRENITDWALSQYRSQYGDSSISKWDIFHYVYAVLHAPRYRDRYQENLKQQLPRIPYSPSKSTFWQLVDAGEQLAGLHLGYEDAEPFELDEVEDENAEYEWRVEKMKFADDDQTVLKYNDFLSLHGIPERAHDYQLGNRSALEWLVNQYRVRTYNRYDITHDPNDPDDKWHIVDLIKRVTTVSVKTVDIVNDLPDLGLPKD
ncbi:putative helicase [Salinibacter ruber]|uniref:site-specific DNA-methyltransferase (adenine-specific) n=1 Tax=Salinibacter ruber TaxID=146919 RepID=A0A9X2U3T5_9BACT|nr:type ISP restriction/modification enzyme [Salinibacter ruber]MCS3859452.1 putative helicase [Salinibacter ruber]MCS3866332.1 putative helicase [Salinibacter ruber]